MSASKGEEATINLEDEGQTRKRTVVRRRRRTKTVDSPIDQTLLAKIVKESCLPEAYTFEIEKSVERIVQANASRVALQMPEGLLLYATVLADVFLRLAACLTEVSVLGDVTYGACCVDDIGAKALNASLLIHYGHSCLVPLQHTVIPCLYVFVEIQIDVDHLVQCLDATLKSEKIPPHVHLLGTVQFRHAFVHLSSQLEELGYESSIPQAKPLSPGEVLGCTSPNLPSNETKAVVCFVADGRFHLESTLIANPHIDAFYRYDPYSKTLTTESYDHQLMRGIRYDAICLSRSAETFGIVLGTLGRQGNPAIVQRIQSLLRAARKRYFLLLLSEITPAKLQLFKRVDAWVQVACPRLSIDWGHMLSDKPVLSPYELFVSLGEEEWRDQYPMDYYSFESGPWSNFYVENSRRELCK